jgi:hypothetical protein
MSFLALINFKYFDLPSFVISLAFKHEKKIRSSVLLCSLVDSDVANLSPFGVDIDVDIDTQADSEASTDGTNTREESSPLSATGAVWSGGVQSKRIEVHTISARKVTLEQRTVSKSR